MRKTTLVAAMLVVVFATSATAGDFTTLESGNQSANQNAILLSDQEMDTITAGLESNIRVDLVREDAGMSVGTVPGELYNQVNGAIGCDSECNIPYNTPADSLPPIPYGQAIEINQGA